VSEPAAGPIELVRRLLDEVINDATLGELGSLS
jgi:hypothetical protein